MVKSDIELRIFYSKAKPLNSTVLPDVHYPTEHHGKRYKRHAQGMTEVRRET